MATIDRDSSHPNVIRAYGDDVIGDGNDPRLELRNAVEAASGLPVGAGTHHFWVVFVVGAKDNDSNNAHTSAASHGEIRIGDPSVRAVADDVTTLVHEVGHGWLVPNPLQFQVSGQTIGADPRDWIENNEGRAYSGPLLVGRQCSHWGGYFWAEHSPMDGLAFGRLDPEDGFQRWQQLPNPTLQVTPTDQPPVSIGWNRFNDLDLATMGVIRPENAYPDQQGQVHWIEPRLTAPLGFRAGLLVAFQIGLVNPEDPAQRVANDFIFFGLSQDHQRLAVERTDGSVLAEARLGPAYHPLGPGHHSVALRAVRHGDTLRFDARLDSSTVPAAGFGDSPGTATVPPDLPGVPGLFDELDHPASAGDFRQWQTVGTVRDARAPLAIGLDTAHVTTGKAIIGFVETSFFTLEVLDLPGLLGSSGLRKQSPRIHRFDAVPGLLHDWSKLDTGTPMLQTPSRGPMLRTQRGRLFMRLPIDVPLRDDADPCGSEGADPGETVPPYEQGPFVNKAPMVVLKAPSGNFAFGSSVRAVRSLYQRSSGGALDSVICGRERSIPAAGLVTTDAMRAQLVADHDCRIAYFVVARDLPSITTAMLDHVDSVRRYMDVAFPAATRGLRGLSSQLTWPG
jgi:hypothetical protein